MTGRCVVSKELVVTDRNAGEVLALLRAGFNVEWLPNERAVRPSSNGDATIMRQRMRRGRRRVNLTPSEISELVALRKKGCTTKTLARKFRMSISGVRNALHRVAKEGGSAA